MCYKMTSFHQNAEKTHNIKTVNRFFENVWRVHIFGNDINKSEFYELRNLKNAYYHSVQNILYFCLLPKNVRIKICKNVIFLVCMGVKLGLLH
jgi:hypothetical protein